MKKFYILYLIFFIFLVGCATKTTPIFVSINSPQIKISDEGFLKEGLGYKEILIYKDGNEPIDITLKKDAICIESKCFSKYEFMKKYFSGVDKNIFDKILNKKPLSVGIIKKTSNGFIQKSKNIIYIVSNNKILFKDKQREITIFIKFLRESK